MFNVTPLRAPTMVQKLDFRGLLEECPLVEIDVPEQIGRRLTPKDAALNLALGLYVSNEVTLGQAAETAGVSQTQFLEELCKRKIPYHYDLDDLKQDVETVDILLRDRRL
jgi:predicted HTH domain antitoxin